MSLLRCRAAARGPGVIPPSHQSPDAQCLEWPQLLLQGDNRWVDPEPVAPMAGRFRLRAAVNWINLSTPAGLLLARFAAEPQVHRGPRGLWVARGYRWSVPPAPAFTLGSVVLLRSASRAGVDPVASIPAHLLDHEERHATQYAFCGGIVMPLAYLAGAGWSWLRTGDFASRNVFERRAGLVSGGYPENPIRPLRAAFTRPRRSDLPAVVHT